MTELDTRTATADEARALTDRIKTGVDAIWELIKQAYQSRAWSALGYGSWDDYCQREFGTSSLRLPREERQEVVASMREIGMTTRMIASATGLSVGSVHGSRPSVQNRTVGQATGLDGRERPASRADAEANREKAATFVKQNPDASARQVAAEAGVSPTTAADVKKRVTENRPVHPDEDPPPPHFVQRPDGTLAQLGTPDGNAAAEELLAQVPAAQTPPPLPKRAPGRFVIIVITVDPETPYRIRDIEYYTTDDLSAALEIQDRIGQSNSGAYQGFAYADILDRNRPLPDLAAKVGELNDLEDEEENLNHG